MIAGDQHLVAMWLLRKPVAEGSDLAHVPPLSEVATVHQDIASRHLDLCVRPTHLGRVCVTDDDKPDLLSVRCLLEALCSKILDGNLGVVAFLRD